MARYSGILGFFATLGIVFGSTASDNRYIRQGHARVAVVGAGAVGTTAAYAIALRNIASEIMLISRTESHCLGEVLDLSDALPGITTAVFKHGVYKDAVLADIVILTVGGRRQPGQSRLDLIADNKTIMAEVLEQMGELNPSAIVIVVSNPVDIMTDFVRQHVNLPPSQVFGSGTMLDTARLRVALAERLHIAEQSIAAYIIGEHGDSQVAVWSSANVAGAPLSAFSTLDHAEFDQLASAARAKGQKIIELKKATFYGIGVCVAELCEAIIFNKKRVFPLSCFIEELGLCISMPAVLGERGVEQILQVPLDTQEHDQFKKSVDVLKATIASIRW